MCGHDIQNAISGSTLLGNIILLQLDIIRIIIADTIKF